MYNNTTNGCANQPLKFQKRFVRAVDILDDREEAGVRFINDATCLLDLLTPLELHLLKTANINVNPNRCR